MNRSLTRTFSVPSDAIRAGNFAGFAPICNPLSIDAATGSCTPFANNQIPAERIDPIAAGFLQHVPRATSAAQIQNLTSVENSTRDIDQFSIRVDHRMTGADLDRWTLQYDGRFHVVRLPPQPARRALRQFHDRPRRTPLQDWRVSFPSANATGTIGASLMDHAYNVEYSQTWSGGLQYELFPSTMGEVSYMGTWTLGADNATVRNIPEPGPGPIQSRRPIPQLSRINAIRFDGKSIYHGVTLKAERRLRNHFAYDASYTLSTSKDDASSPGATEAEANLPQKRAKHLRSVGGVGSLELRSSASVRRERRV